ncbi:MAG: prepilin-type N-terminal cleavage/methylation domain-containing protein [Candidatus Azotimanducaceae bacterium]|jgi:prepilin-type N-terminal cleavage/methylation domain-containing protein
MIKITLTKGYSLVEVLVSITILLLALVGPMTIASQGIKSATFALEQNTAFFLAQEGLEIMFALRSNYALEEFEDEYGLESDTPGEQWDWVNEGNGGLGGCSLIGPTDTCDIGVDFGDLVLDSDNFVDCSSDPEDCRLYFDDEPNKIVYTHDSDDGAGGILPQSPYTRIITVTYITQFVAEVTSEVSWTSSVFGGATQTVEATTRLYDLFI